MSSIWKKVQFAANQVVEIATGQKIEISDGEQSGVARLDAATEALMTIPYAHHEIHAGSRFFIEELVSGVADEATRDYLIIVPDTTKWPHFIFEVSANKQTSVHLYEDTNSTGGTAMSCYNRNRNSANTCTLTITHTPTVTTVGTLLLSHQFGEAAGGPIQASGGVTGGRGELILKQDTKYLLRLTSAGSSNDMNIEMDWYEHTDRN